MNEEVSFAEFFNNRLKERGYTLKKLAEVSGIAIKHLENLSLGKAGDLPPAPYLHGYLMRLGEILNFDAAPWWERLQAETGLAISGRTDELPKNRFARASNKKAIILAALGVLVVLYLALRLPHILGRPQLIVTAPAEAAVTVTNEEFLLKGQIIDGDRVLVNGEDVTIASDGTWQKNVLLQPGVNTFEIQAKKLLGRSSTAVRQITYAPPASEPAPFPKSALPPSATSTKPANPTP